MRASTPFFKSLSARERTLSMNHALAGLLNTALREVGNVARLTPLQRHYLVTETGYVYQHFGFSVFGPNARRFLASQLCACSGAEEGNVEAWLETVGFMLLEDFNILKIVTGEPDWESVDKAFFRDFSRRILCAESGESSDFGLNAWNDIFIDGLMSRTAQWLEKAQYGDAGAVKRDVLDYLSGNPFADFLAPSILEGIEIVSQNSLQLLIWRILFLTSFADIRQEAKFIIRGGSLEQEQAATQLAALLSMFLPHEASDGSLLLPPSPISLAQITNVLRSGFCSPQFDCALFRNWLGLPERQVQRDLLGLVKYGLKAGLLFEVPTSRSGKGYGLTLGALKILKPFHAAITKAVLRTADVTVRNESTESTESACC